MQGVTYDVVVVDYELMGRIVYVCDYVDSHLIALPDKAPVVRVYRGPFESAVALARTLADLFSGPDPLCKGPWLVRPRGDISLLTKWGTFLG